MVLRDKLMYANDMHKWRFVMGMLFLSVIS